MKNHLKCIASPRTWTVDRGDTIFTMRPNPGAHAFDAGLPLGVIIRDMLHFAKTAGEVRKLLHTNEVLVDGKRRKDHRYLVGLFDVVSFSTIGKDYRVLLDKKGKITLFEIPSTERGLKVCRIVGKTIMKKGQVQFNLHDGKNLTTTTKANVGDSFLISLPKAEIKEILPLHPGAAVFLIKGKHSGDVGNLKEIKGKEALYTIDGGDIETAKDYLFVVGKSKPLLKVNI